MILFYHGKNPVLRFAFISLLLVFLIFFIIVGAAGTLDSFSLIGRAPVSERTFAADKILSRSFKLPTPVAALSPKPADNRLHMVFSGTSVCSLDKTARVFCALYSIQNNIFGQIRFYLILFLSILFLLHRRSAIIFLHKRDAAKGTALTI